jgi:uncharacterized protein involved in exopolysaccharide biosynthesis
VSDNNPNREKLPVAGGYFVPLVSSGSDREVSFVEIYRVLKGARLLILGVTLLSAAMSVAVAFLMTPVYRAEVLLLPVSEDGGGSGALGRIVSDFGGLAGLAGIDLGVGGSKAQAVATLQSRVLTEGYIREQKLLPILFAGSWDSAAGQWTVEEAEVPSLWEATRYFGEEVRQVIEDKNTGLVRLMINWTDPVLAAQWANGLVSSANKYLRQQAIERSERNTKYLQASLKTTSVVEIQQVMYRLLEGEVKSTMLAQGNDEFAFQIIDPAVVPEEWVSPKRVLICALGILVGLLLGCGFVLVRHMVTESPGASN